MMPPGAWRHAGHARKFGKCQLPVETAHDASRAGLASWERVFAKVSHFLLYAILMIRPVNGFVMSAVSNHPADVFGHFK